VVALALLSLMPVLFWLRGRAGRPMKVRGGMLSPSGDFVAGD
jgi:hypothetical protein